MLKQRVVTAVVLLVLLAAILATGSVKLFAVFMLFVVIAAAWEWDGLRTGVLPSPMPFVLVALTFATVFAFSWSDRGNAFWREGVLAVDGIATALWLVLVPRVLSRRTSLATHGFRFSLLGAILLLAAWIGAVALYQRGQSTLLAFVSVPIVADTAAYFVGRKFGRRKLAPSISPGKTIEGAIGGMAAVLLTHGTWVMLSQQPLSMIALFVVLTALSIAGDLFESLMKRQAGVKDSSQLLPGHGGVLDRIDAQLPVLTVGALALALLDFTRN